MENVWKCYIFLIFENKRIQKNPHWKLIINVMTIMSRLASTTENELRCRTLTGASCWNLACIRNVHEVTSILWRCWGVTRIHELRASEDQVFGTEITKLMDKVAWLVVQHGSPSGCTNNKLIASSTDRGGEMDRQRTVDMQSLVIVLIENVAGAHLDARTIRDVYTPRSAQRDLCGLF